MFTSEQKTWIVFEYGRNPSPTALKRKFLLNFNIQGREKTKYQPHLFIRVVETFKKNGISKEKSKGAKISKATPEAQQLVSEEIQEQPDSSIRQIAKRLDFTTSTTHKILRKQLFKRCFGISEAKVFKPGDKPTHRQPMASPQSRSQSIGLLVLV